MRRLETPGPDNVREAGPKTRDVFDRTKKSGATCRRWDDGWRCALGLSMPYRSSSTIHVTSGAASSISSRSGGSGSVYRRGG